jgi:hypothetical protein
VHRLYASWHMAGEVVQRKETFRLSKTHATGRIVPGFEFCCLRNSAYR